MVEISEELGRGNLHVFIDEYGSPSISVENAGVTNSYIVVAICVYEADLDVVVKHVEKIREKNFQQGEIKSKNVADNDVRRIKILKELIYPKWYAFAFCADKSKVDPGSGLAYKKSFIKFFSRKMCERILAIHPSINVTSDEHGKKEFQNQFNEYINSKLKIDLFQNFNFRFQDSKSNVMLQAADFVAGSLARVFDSKMRSSNGPEILGLVKKSCSIEHWPKAFGRVEFEQQDGSNSRDMDFVIRNHCVSKACKYVEQIEDVTDSQEIIARYEFLNSLILHDRWGEKNTFLPTKILLKEIDRRIGEPFGVHKFRSSVIAKLRDDGLIIASSTKGYKLPQTLNDLRELVLFNNSIVSPMISRLKKARRSILDVTLGKTDILAGEDVAHLLKVIEGFDDSYLPN